MAADAAAPLGAGGRTGEGMRSWLVGSPLDVPTTRPAPELTENVTRLRHRHSHSVSQHRAGSLGLGRMEY